MHNIIRVGEIKGQEKFGGGIPLEQMIDKDHIKGQTRKVENDAPLSECRVGYVVRRIHIIKMITKKHVLSKLFHLF